MIVPTKSQAQGVYNLDTIKETHYHHNLVFIHPDLPSRRNGLAVLCVCRLLAVPPPNAELNDPCKDDDEHERRRSPRQSQEFAAPVGYQANIVALVVDNGARLDDDSRDERTREADSKERKHAHKEVDARRQPSGHEDSSRRREQRNKNQPDSNTVQHEHGTHQCIQRLDSCLDVLGPVEIVKRDVHARLVERILDDLRRIELVHGVVLAAFGNVLVDV